MIPKTLHLYWGKNQPLSYLRYLTVYSFAKFNPTWKIKVWVPLETSYHAPWTTGEQSNLYKGIDYLPYLNEYVNYVDFNGIGISNDLSEVHKSDLLRWWLLGNFGGVWSDFDILYIRSLPDSLAMSWKGAGLCSYRAVPAHPFDYLAIGFHVSEGEAGKAFFKDLFELGRSQIPQTRYQAFGAELLQQLLKKRGEKDTFKIPPELVYPYYTCLNISTYWKPVMLNLKQSIGCHWYAGTPNSAKHEAEVMPDRIWRLSRKYAICKEAIRVIEV